MAVSWAVGVRRHRLYDGTAAGQPSKKSEVFRDFGFLAARCGLTEPIFVDYHRDAGICFVDGLEKHLIDFRSFSCPVEEYVHRTYIGHYNPAGNFFTAMAMRDAMVKWLDPKPKPYR